MKDILAVISKAIILVFFYLLHAQVGFAQLKPDTLQAVTVFGFPETKYAVGATRTPIDSAMQLLFAQDNLASLIQQATPVYIKGRGVGNLASISFRGTGAEHTAVLWNGININSPSLGQSDFYNLPNVGYDQIGITAGAGSTVFGTDAIGGTITLNSKPQWLEGWQLSAGQTWGSLGKWNTDIGLAYGKGDVEFSTKFYHQWVENDFPFTNTQLPGRPTERMQNANFESYGLVQDVFWEISNRDKLSFHAWYNKNDREIQPALASANNDDEQQDENLRLVASYQHISDWGVSTAKVSWVHDFMRFFDGSNTFRTALNRFTGILEHEKQLNNRLESKLGIQVGHFTMPEGSFRNDTSETRMDLYWLSIWKPSEALELSLNLRQTLLKGLDPDFTPSLGFQWRIFHSKSKQHQLLWKGTASRSFRVPTLNERFFEPGGNPNILPEQGTNLESGFSYQLTKAYTKLEISTTYFLNVIDNWVLWRNNGSFWTPRNVREVRNQGLEAHLKLDKTFGKLKVSLGGNYAYTLSEVLADNANSFAIGKELPYVPKHKMSGFVNGTYRGWQLVFNGNYTGTRDGIGGNQLDAFTLFNLSVAKSIKIKKQRFQLSASLFNIFNQEYQNWEGFAMPLKNWQLSFRTQFNTHNQ